MDPQWTTSLALTPRAVADLPAGADRDIGSGLSRDAGVFLDAPEAEEALRLMALNA